MLQGLQINPKARHTRPLSTLPPDSNGSPTQEETGDSDAERLERLMAEVRRIREDRGEPDTEAKQQQIEQRPWQSRESRDPRRESRPSRSSARNWEAPSTPAFKGRSREAGRSADPNNKVDEEGQYRSVLAEEEKVKHESMQAAEEASEGGEGEGDDAKSLKAAKSAALLTTAARAVPVSPSYFSRKSDFNDSILLLQKLMRKYAHLPTLPNDQVKRVVFLTRRDYRLAVGEDIKAAEYRRAMNMVKRLHKIHPKLLPEKVKMAIAKFKRDLNTNMLNKRDIPIDKFGRALGTGRRKTSVARAWVVEGTGEVLVNGKSLADAFGRIHDRESAVWALKATARTDKYNVWALVEGGGTTGQAEALALAVAKALEAHEPALKPALRRGKCFAWSFIWSLFIWLTLTFL